MSGVGELAKRGALVTLGLALLAGACSLPPWGDEAEDAGTPEPDAGKPMESPPRDGGASTADAMGAGGAPAGAEDAGDAGAAVPELASCDWSGTQCEDGHARSCEAGQVVAEQSCGALGCFDATRCVAPGAGSAIATSAAGQTASAGCEVFEASACGSCLNANCCDVSLACSEETACVELWDCLGGCEDLTCEDACAALYPKGVEPAVALLYCGDTQCSAACEDEPCANFPFEYGFACGPNLSPDADPNALYLCHQGQTAGAVVCAAGCHIGALGEPDYCNDTDPCANDPYDGWACGGSLATPYAAPNLFYRCSGQRTVDTIVCASCLPAPPGSPDTCL